MNAKLKDYKFIKKGYFTTLSKFEGKLNDYAKKGYVVVSITHLYSSARLIALIAKATER